MSFSVPPQLVVSSCHSHSHFVAVVSTRIRRPLSHMPVGPVRQLREPPGGAAITGPSHHLGGLSPETGGGDSAQQRHPEVDRTQEKEGTDMELPNNGGSLDARELNALRTRGLRGGSHVERDHIPRAGVGGQIGAEERRQGVNPLDTEAMRQIEIGNLAALQVLLLADVDRPRLVLASGKVVLDPMSGEPLVDRSVRLPVVDRLLRVTKQRAALRGLDMPRRREAEVVTPEMIDGEIRRLKERADRKEAELVQMGIEVPPRE